MVAKRFCQSGPVKTAKLAMLSGWEKWHTVNPYMLKTADHTTQNALICLLIKLEQQFKKMWPTGLMCLHPSWWVAVM